MKITAVIYVRTFIRVPTYIPWSCGSLFLHSFVLLHKLSIMINISAFFQPHMLTPELKDTSRPYEGYKTYRDYSSHFFVDSQWTKIMVEFFDEMGKFNKARFSLLNQKQRALLIDLWIDRTSISGYCNSHSIHFDQFFSAFFAEYNKRENSAEKANSAISVYNIGNSCGLQQQNNGNSTGLPVQNTEKFKSFLVKRYR